MNHEHKEYETTKEGILLRCLRLGQVSSTKAEMEKNKKGMGNEKEVMQVQRQLSAN